MQIPKIKYIFSLNFEEEFDRNKDQYPIYRPNLTDGSKGKTQEDVLQYVRRK